MRKILENLLAALAPLQIMGKPIASLDETLALRITEAVQILNEPATEADVVALINEIRGQSLSAAMVDLKAAIQKLQSLKQADDAAYCIGCGTYPKGPYNCATCSRAEEHEGEQAYVSDWPNTIDS